MLMIAAYVTADKHTIYAITQIFSSFALDFIKALKKIKRKDATVQTLKMSSIAPSPFEHVEKSQA